MDLIVPFITGLTAGGLSCLAVQGGLLASSIAHEVEQSIGDKPGGHRIPTPRTETPSGAGAQLVSAAPARRSGRLVRKGAAAGPISPLPGRTTTATRPRAARPLILFLVAKLVAYTVLGFFLGLLGSVMQLSAMTRAVLQAAIGVFMIGTALRMFDVHPIFRYFALEPPKFITRYIRRKSKGEASAVTPLFLGTLTVLIPCGITQAMMAVAMGTGSAMAGAMIMFAFILGTTPVFFAVAYMATRMGARLESNFVRLVAIVVLVLGLISVDAGLTLGGWPYSFSNLRLASTSSIGVAEASTAAQGQAATQQSRPSTTNPVNSGDAFTGPPSPNPAPVVQAVAAAPATSTSGVAASSAAPTPIVLTINVVNSGYQPNVLHAKAGQPLQMSLVTKNTSGCARAFVVPALGFQKVLPVTGTTTIDVPQQKAGTKLYFSCSMGMYSGVIVFDA
jgi:uncharacterized protein